MKIYYIVFAVIGAVLAVCFAWTNAQVLAIEAKYPPAGTFSGPEGERMHFVDVAQNTGASVPVILFLHGASGNLNDQMVPFSPVLKDKARLIFVDRPGHGYSDRAGAETPQQQATLYKNLLDRLNVEQVTVVGHSLGAASATAFAVLYPEHTNGLVLVAPATHPWSTGVSWYYDVAAYPVIGQLFTETVLVPFGLQTLDKASNSVFAPQKPPEDYVEQAAIPLAFRPWVFRNNARDVAGLNEFVSKFSNRYSQITTPTIIITGDTDDIVSASIHSIGLERDIKGSRLIVLPGIGHKPEYVATKAVADAIMNITGN